MKVRAFFQISLFILLSSCGNYLEQKSGTGDDNIDLATVALSFSTMKSALFARHCTECHEEYGSFSGVINQLTNIASAIESNQMPKSAAPLSDNLKALLHAWIAAGAPEVEGGPPGQSSLPPLAANWNSISQNIIFPRCLVCHNANGQAKFLDLSSRQVIFDARNRVLPAASGQKLIDIDTPTNSYILNVIEDPSEPMPPTWSNIRRLNADEIKALMDWFGLGLP